MNPLRDQMRSVRMAQISESEGSLRVLRGVLVFKKFLFVEPLLLVDLVKQANCFRDIAGRVSLLRRFAKGRDIRFQIARAPRASIRTPAVCQSPINLKKVTAY